MDKYFEALAKYDEWEHEMTQKAKATARHWFKDYTENNIGFVQWKTSWEINTFRYVLKKIQVILHHLGIIMDWDTEGDIEVDDDDETMLVAGIFLLSKSECGSPDSDTETTSECDEESEREETDPIA
jgi:hypothetical protein